MAVKSAAEIYRDFETDGVQASGPHRPVKRDIRELTLLIQGLLAASGPSLGYSALALLNADLAHVANTLAFVYGDASPANNGSYIKSGAFGAGSWTRIADLPTPIVNLTVTGGTPNAIVASAPETPQQPGLKLYLLTPTANNTGAVTLNYNGTGDIPIKNAFGATLAAGSLMVGSPVLMMRQSGYFQLLISANVDASTILADTVAARDAAIAAAASSSIISALDRTALKTLDTTVTKTAHLREAGREGVFIWRSGIDYSALVAADPEEGIYIKANAIAASAGAWVRNRTPGIYDVKWFGAKGDNSTNDYPKLQATVNLCQTELGGTVLFSQGGYRCDTGLVINTALVRLEGVGDKRCSIYTDVANVNLITIAAARCTLKNLSLFEKVQCNVASAIVTLDAGAVQCILEELDIVGGYYCLRALAGSADNEVRNSCSMRLATGGAGLYALGTGTLFVDRCLLNQDWPSGGSNPPAPANDRGARANNTIYAAKDFITLGSFILQTLSGGTSHATTAPSLTGVWYGAPITDGTVTWYIAGHASGVAALVDSDCSYVSFEDCDMTGAYVNAFRQENNLGVGHVAPDRTELINCTAAATIANGYLINAARRFKASECELQVPVGNSATNTAIFINTGVAGDVKILDCDIASGWDIGIWLAYGAGGRATVSQNDIFGCSVAAVRVSGGVSKFRIVDNGLGASATYGANGKGVEILTGASNNYVVTANDFVGATIGLNDNATGTPTRYTAGNIG
ncbi:right-handed parallel beta-helix repeat-containing protein [Bradyrhizobium liaoningense]|uniref:right-handed parallel beta-helix repeat-containing protein n=1 Tax=Bradyrhizobium liaoningense TaxID=43992 RepID=UPI001BAAE3FF|nr:right-handed parallel beta-helix repeat-containing protein [Bradyrhizobium liaoningense]MBR0855675.1 hypothetical protein [Bradyrhizobium liaoningense]